MSAQATTTPAPASQRMMPLALLVLLFAALVWPPIVLNAAGTNEAFDQRSFHLPLVRSFAQELPAVDLREYNSATAPGYHLTLAVIARAISDDARLLRFIGSLFSLGLLIAAWWFAARWTNEWVAFALLGPFLFSTYVLGAAIWLTTDNAALLFVTLAVGGSIAMPLTFSRAARWSGLATLAVFFRQIHVWCIGPAGIALLLQTPLWSSEVGWRDWLLRAMVLLMPFALVGVFIALWGGLTPPVYADLHNAGANPASIVLTLAVFGVFGAPLVLFVINQPLVQSAWLKMLIAAAVGIVLAIAIPSSYARDGGRWGGSLWEIAARTPTVDDRSIVLIILAAIGAMVLALWHTAAVERGRRREVNLLMIALLAWSLAQAMNSQAWQRYVEPWALIMLVWFAALGLGHRGLPRAPWRWIGLIALILLQVAAAGWKVYWPMFESTSHAAGGG